MRRARTGLHRYLLQCRLHLSAVAEGPVELAEPLNLALHHSLSLVRRSSTPGVLGAAGVTATPSLKESRGSQVERHLVVMRISNTSFLSPIMRSCELFILDIATIRVCECTWWLQQMEADEGRGRLGKLTVYILITIAWGLQNHLELRVVSFYICLYIQALVNCSSASFSPPFKLPRHT